MEPVKNNMADSIKKFKAVGEAFSGSSGEASIYRFNRAAINTCPSVTAPEAKEVCLYYLFFMLHFFSIF